jgi:hypothetical protein
MDWRSQQEVYIIMWKSPFSGATLSELRKSDIGLERKIETLKFMGISEKDITVVKQPKIWMPETKNKGRKVKAHTRKTAQDEKSKDNVVQFKMVQ